mmetsp:Transcript_105697/g.187978  ORF Transcript_105697/g.187978 Transcript_105697/m.187978 type:complete len:1306 (+) Transcript_105697:40-3957(+)|eukprot:CAMPEP_0197654296 /NCGR_PEP_ID=MMETSP1338-20131121/38762_1 /TAXON_ID=43686 ORGANISM="Pelagodinium beii, Strain RCC1491" /NCGR_SAMPLE_ID=MMETSP1338 /ASSEMBLY_ACC=CAM_ASM_000754 /LENGTH=1305 /DNA_ID=CAMNT_0043229713 /DNA_START=40 /DNA_END=3957 /DNA_ORIENTATION=-
MPAAGAVSAGQDGVGKALTFKSDAGGTRMPSQSKLERQASGKKDRLNSVSQDVRGASTGLLVSKASRLDKALQALPKSDLKSLQASSHKRARKVLRSLSYPALPSGSRKSLEEEADERLALLSAQNPAGAVTRTSKMRPLAEVLSAGREGKALREFAMEAHHALAEDLCSTTIAQTGASVGLLDVEGLLKANNESDLLAHPSFARSLSEASFSRLQSHGRQAVSLEEASAESPARRQWPSTESFERFYHIPEEMLPLQPLQSQGPQYDPLPPARPTIAGIEDAKSLGMHAYLLPSLLSSATSSSQAQEPQRPRTASGSQGKTPRQPKNIFLATSFYRDACANLGIQPLQPPPIFGPDTVEIQHGSIDGTKQCYAIAEGVKACAPKHIDVIDAFLTDMGAASVVDAAMSSGRLESLSLSGSPLSYRTVLALHTSLRTRSGSSLQQLSLAECGLGGDLEEDPELLPERAASTYARSHSSIFPADAEEDEVMNEALKDLEAMREKKRKEIEQLEKKKKLKEEAEEKEKEGKDEKEEKRKKDAEAEDTEEAQGEEAEEEQTAEEVKPTPVILPLLALLARPTSSLRKLDLSRSILSPAAVLALTRGLRTTALEVLTLEQCCLNDEAVDTLAVGVTQNRMLLELSVRGNDLSGEPGSGSMLLDAAGRHARLALLDLAENLLPKECAEELCSALRWSLSLVSVHLLGGSGAEQDALAIQRACRKWIAESTGKPGPDGEVQIPEPEDGDEYKELIVCRALHVEGLKEWRVVSPDPKPIVEPKNAGSGPDGATVEPVLTSWMPSCCWIRQRCAAVDYTWVVPDKGHGDETGAPNAKLYVRPSFADFARIELKRLRIAGARHLQFGARMLVPAGQHWHVFEAEVNGKRTLYSSEREPAVEVADAQLTEQQMETFEKMQMMHRYSGPLNVRAAGMESFQIPEETTVSDQRIEPETDAWAEPPSRIKAWNDCCEEDLKHIYLKDLCHVNEEPEVKATLRQKYKLYYECYALFSGRSQWPLIRQVDVYGFFEEARLLDRGPFGGPQSPASPSSRGKEQSADDQSEWPQLKLQDVQQMLVQTIMNRDPKQDAAKGGTASQRRAEEVAAKQREGMPVTRPHFIEVLLRAAMALKKGEPSASVAFRRFADEVISARIMQPPLAPFPRGLAMGVGEVCDVLLARRKTLREAWERFSSSEVAFQRLAQLVKLCDRTFTAKHVQSVYALVRKPNPDFKPEPGKRGGQGLRYQEFCEAVARFALVWKRSSGSMGSHMGSRDTASPRNLWPLHAQVGHPVREKAIAARLEYFLDRLAERMRPSVL